MKKIHNPYDNFKRWLGGNGLTYKDVSELLGLSIATVSSKINGQSDFLLSEIQLLKKHYNLDSEIFFTNIVA